jgi:transposase
MNKADAVVVGVGRALKRRQWTRQDKRRIVEETLVPGASVALVARANEVNANQVHSWRRLHERGLLEADGVTPTLLPVRVVSDESIAPAASVGTPDVRGHVHQQRRSRSVGVIQIETERGRLRIEGPADPKALRVALECLLA